MSVFRDRDRGNHSSHLFLLQMSNPRLKGRGVAFPELLSVVAVRRQASVTDFSFAADIKRTQSTSKGKEKENLGPWFSRRALYLISSNGASKAMAANLNELM